MDLNSPHLSFLEHLATWPLTTLAYLQALGVLIDFCHENVLDVKQACQLDAILVMFFNLPFLEGVGVGPGQKVLSALGPFLPQAGCLGQWRLPRAHRCPQVLKSLRPPPLSASHTPNVSHCV